jgi:hypothetical protein
MSTARLACKSLTICRQPGYGARMDRRRVHLAHHFNGILLGNKQQNPPATEDSAAIARKSSPQSLKMLDHF